MKNQLPFSMDLPFVLDATPDALIIVNHRGEIVHVNAQVGTLFGYDRDELLGQAVEKLMPQRYRDKHVGHRAGYLTHPRIRPMGVCLDLYGIKKNGNEFPIEISLSPLALEEGTITLATIRDVTDRKRFEQTLREKNLELEKASLAKDSFLASMSHELRTPLNAIIGFTGTLLMRLPGPLTADQEKQLTTIQRSAKHLLSLINDLLDMAKIESGKVDIHVESVHLQTLLEEIATTLRPLAQNKGLSFTIEAPSNPLYFETDRRALNQILINLINNAIKFTEAGHIQVIVTEQRREDRYQLTISVIDTGMGIKPEHQSKLFNAFEQVRTQQGLEGTGLGLHLSQKLAALLGGRIECQSEPSKGSQFSLIFSKKVKVSA
jgi:PAS domain S-box-containing protein